MMVLKYYSDENLLQLEVLLGQWKGANGDKRLIISKRVQALVKQINLMEKFVLAGGESLFANDEMTIREDSDMEQDLPSELQATCLALVKEDEKNRPQLSLFFYQIFFRMLKNSQLYPSLFHCR